MPIANCQLEQGQAGKITSMVTLGFSIPLSVLLNSWLEINVGIGKKKSPIGNRQSAMTALLNSRATAPLATLAVDLLNLGN